MKYRIVALLLMAVAFLWVGSAFMTACASDDAPKMTKEDLKGRLGDPEVVVVDVRAGGSWDNSRDQDQGSRARGSDRSAELGRKISQGQDAGLLLLVRQ